MTSPPSDTESNLSGFMRYNEKEFKPLYTSIIQKMELINQDILEVEKNLKNLMKKAGPMEAQLATLLQSLPKPNLSISMETD
ncbi:hypothetical protein RR46_04147 [Papilio xuthus]|uniref:Uncharacterized protein n=1 Tax=Papilio xuthus TaxID=66420 RepID=A0A194QNG8_PAPXU|nr:hypothetical protein RR46_04147 [Papilio xuthus]